MKGLTSERDTELRMFARWVDGVRSFMTGLDVIMGAEKGRGWDSEAGGRKLGGTVGERRGSRGWNQV